MKRLVFFVVASLIAALLLCFSLAAVPQELTVAPSSAGKKEPAKPISDKPGVAYKQVIVLKGGNLALIAEKCGHSQTDWTALYEANPNLPKPTKAGLMWGVLVFPEQILNLPAGWSYSTLDSEYLAPVSDPQEERASEETGPPIPPKTNQPEDTNTSVDDSLFWLLIPAVAITLVTCLVLSCLRRQRNPSRYPPMIPGGLVDDLHVAASQLHVSYGRKYKRIERGRLVRYSGPFRVLVKRMAFGDGVSRAVYLKPDNEVYRGILPDGGFNYFLRSCGNLGPEFEIPPGWGFLLLQSGNIDRTVYESPMTATAADPISPVAPVPPIPPVPPAPVFPTEPAPAPVPEPESEPEPEPAPAPAEPSASKEEPINVQEVPVAEAEVTTTQKRVMVTLGDISIVVVGNGKIPATKMEMEDGVTVTIMQEK